MGFIRKAARAICRSWSTTCSISPRSRPARSSSGRASSRSRDLFGALRGMLRPLLVNDAVRLVFEEPDEPADAAHRRGQGVADPAQLHLERAEVHRARRGPRVGGSRTRRRRRSSSRSPTPASASPPSDQERIFEEFAQIENPLQRGSRAPASACRSAGSSPSCSAAACRVESAPGQGSTFSLVGAARLRAGRQPSAGRAAERIPSALPVLVVEDAPEDQLLYEKYLKGADFQVLPARTLARRARRSRAVTAGDHARHPAGRRQDSWSFLARAKTDRPPQIPIIVVTTVEDQARGSPSARMPTA